MLPKEQRIAVYSILFTTAFADEELHRNEIAVIIEALGSQNESPLSERMEVSKVIRDPEPLELSLSTIKAGLGDLPAVVILLMMDVIAADDIVTDSELEILRLALTTIGLRDMNIHSTRYIYQRLIELEKLYMKNSKSNNTWLGTTISQLVTILNGAGDVVDVYPRPGLCEKIEVEDLCLVTVMNALKEQKKRRRISDTLNRYSCGRDPKRQDD